MVQLFYGWLQDYLKAGLLQPLPASDFSAVEIEREFFPIVQQMKVDGKYYALPTAVRSLALFWNKTLFKEAGLDPDRPPATLDELVDYAKKLTKRSPNGDLLQEGLTHRHGRPGSSLAARGADPSVRRRALLGRQEDRRLQHRRGCCRHAVVHRSCRASRRWDRSDS